MVFSCSVISMNYTYADTKSNYIADLNKKEFKSAIKKYKAKIDSLAQNKRINTYLFDQSIRTYEDQIFNIIDIDAPTESEITSLASLVKTTIGLLHTISTEISSIEKVLDQEPILLKYDSYLNESDRLELYYDLKNLRARHIEYSNKVSTLHEVWKMAYLVHFESCSRKNLREQFLINYDPMFSSVINHRNYGDFFFEVRSSKKNAARVEALAEQRRQEDYERIKRIRQIEVQRKERARIASLKREHDAKEKSKRTSSKSQEIEEFVDYSSNYSNRGEDRPNEFMRKMQAILAESNTLVQEARERRLYNGLTKAEMERNNRFALKYLTNESETSSDDYSDDSVEPRPKYDPTDDPDYVESECSKRVREAMEDPEATAVPHC